MAESEYMLECPGNSSDFLILKDSRWLQDSEVSHQLTRLKGRWVVSLVFIDRENPFRIRCRKITDYSTKQKATLNAKLLQRGAAKDVRGTIKTNCDAFHICHN